MYIVPEDGVEMATVAVLAASFSLREDEPNPCNVRIAEEAFRICDELIAAGHVPILSAQWEVDLALHERRTADDFQFLPREVVIDQGVIPYVGSIGQLDDGQYLGTREVYDEALKLFREHGCTHFVGVAQPFIHQPYLYAMARKDFKLIWKRTRKIGFDKESTQWWCRSWWQFALQSVRLALGLEHGYNGRQEPQS